MKNLLIVILTMISFGTQCQQVILKNSVLINGLSYTITLEKVNGKIDVWARKVLQQSNKDDINILSITTKIVPTKDQAMNLICRSKTIYDDVKFTVGCGSIVGTGICVATGGGAGIGVPVCIATAGYMATTGAIDCVAGIVDIIGSQFGYSDFGYAAEQAFGSLSPSSIVSNAIDEMCRDWKGNK